MSDLSRIAAASLLLATVAFGPMTAGAEAQRFIPDITISSTVPPTPPTPPIPAGSGDLNPYGVAFVPRNFPESNTIAPGDILVSNFNNSDNIQGTGTTIVKLKPNVVTPSMQAPVFFTSTPIGLTTALGVLQRGFVVVGNLPNQPLPDGSLPPGSLQFINRHGTVETTVPGSGLPGSPLDGPWDLTIDDDYSYPVIYVSNVLNGTVARLNLTLTSNSVTVTNKTVIASGYMFGTDPTAFVLGPTGLAHDRVTDILYVASTADNAIFTIFNASTRNAPPSGKSTGMMIASGGQLRGPLALAFAPNGDLITSNGDAVKPDPTHPSEIVELTKTGEFVSQFNISSAQGGAFGLAVATVGFDTARLAAVNDSTNEILIIDQNVVLGE